MNYQLIQFMKLQNCCIFLTKLRTKGYGVPAPLEERKKEKLHLCLIMPDGSTLGLPIYEGENTKDEIAKFKANWKKVTCENARLFDHKISKRKCPKCGGEIHYKNGSEYKFSWCTSCDYQTSEKKTNEHKCSKR